MSTNITLPGAAISSGAVQQLGICPRHGRRGTKVRQQKFGSKTPGWVLVIAVPALLIAAIIAEQIRKRVEGPVPVCEECFKDRRSFRLLLAAVWLVDLLLFVAGMAGTSVLLLGWLVVTVLALILGTRTSRYRVQGTVSADGLFVELRKVDGSFAAACHQMMLAASEPTAAYAPTPGTTVLPR